MKVTRIGNYVRVNMIETSQGHGIERGTLVTFYIGAAAYDQSFPDGTFEKASYLTRIQMSDFVIVNDELLKCRTLVEDLVNAYVKHTLPTPADWL